MLKVNFRLSLFLLLPLFAFSQKAAFQLYTTEDGLSRNTIWGITQDRQDFLWLATDDGFNRFDGHHFLNHNNSDDPVFTKVRKTGNVIVNGDFLYYWENGQLEALNTIDGSETTIQFEGKILGNRKDWKGITLNMNEGEIVLAVLHEKKKIVYVVRVRDAEIQQIDSIPNFTNHIFHYAVDDRDNLFYLNNHGISKIDHQGVVKQMLAFPPGEMGDMLQSGQGNKMFVHLQGKLWMWEEGMTELQLHPVNQLLDYSYIFDVLETSNGDLWISGSQRHLFNYDASTNELYDFEPELRNLFLNPVDLINIFQDISGTIWLESVLGLLKVVPQRSLFDTYYSKRYDACSGHCSFRGFAEDHEGAIYAGFYANICKIGESGADDPKPLIQHNHSPFEMLFDEGKLILNDGYVYDPVTKVKSNPYQSPGFSYDIGLLEKDEQERLWWAWGRDLYFLEKQTGQPFWKQVGIGNWSHELTVMCYDPTRQWMWLGNSKRLVAINTTTKELVADAAIEEQQFPGVHCIYLDADGKLWIGAETGLVLYDPSTESWKKLTQADGLPNEFVHGIQPEGDSCLWLATNKGLSRFSIATKEFINFYEEDGLLDNEFNRGSSFTASDGKMYFGGIRGVIAFYPADVMSKYQRQKASGNILLHAISMIDEERDTVITDYFHPDEPTLDIFYNNKAVTFEFGLVDHQSTGATQYRYKLDGYNHTWSNPSPNNRVTFSSLPSGDYTFRVEAMNAKGQWLPDELAVQLVVHPPWWATTWAFILYALIIVGIAYGIFSFLKKRWELQNQLFNKKQEAIHLKELDSFKSRLYTNLTHEFRTPLTVMLGMVEKGRLDLRNGKLDDTQAGQTMVSNLKIIERNGEQLLRLINQLLDLSKMEDGSFKLQLQCGDIVSFLRYLTADFGNLAESKNLTLTFSSDLESLEMDYDPEQVQMILTNLLSNAIKFSPPGGEVQITVGSLQSAVGRLDCELRTANCLAITVTDTGIGIAAEDLPHVFDRFYQVDGTATRKNEGTGIGLAHSLELVKIMGGTLSVESTLGQGTVFTILLPIAKGNAPKVLQEKRQPIVRLPDVDDLHKSIDKKIAANEDDTELPQLLIIEDNADLIIYLKSCLEDFYQIMVATNGKSGIEKAIAQIPDLVLSDVMMPEKNGFEVVEFLKNDERTSHIPVVLLTAKTDVASKITGLKRGADAYLPKPFHREELLVTLEMMMDNRRRLQKHFSLSNPIIPNDTVDKESELSEIAVAEVETEFQQEHIFLQKMRGVLEENYADFNFALPQLCDELGMSRYQLFRKMKAISDESASNFIRSYRMEKAKLLFETTDLNVSEVADQVGYKDLAHFSKSFSKSFGVTPSEFRKQ